MQVSQGGGGLLPGFLFGLNLTNDPTDGDHDISFGTGKAKDSTNLVDIDFDTALIKQIDATWSAGTNAGALSSSLTAPANNTWYHVFLVVIGGAADILFDTDVNCVNGIADHSVTSFRRIGSVLTDGAANILPFHQRGDLFHWDAYSNIGISSVTSAGGYFTVSTPLGVECIAVGAVNYNEATATRKVVIFSPLGVTPSAGTDNSLCWNNINNPWTGSFFQFLTNTSSQLGQRGTASDSGVGFAIFGYYDFRGQYK